MEIKVGKFYKTRDGRKVEITSKIGRPEDVVLGHVDNEAFLTLWYPSGMNLRYSQSDYDLVSEWVEPRLLAYIRIRPSMTQGTIRFESEPNALDPLDWRRLPHLDEPITVPDFRDNDE